MLIETWFSSIAFQAVVQYIFIKSETYLLVVKENLIMRTVWVSALCCAAGTTFMKFHGNIFCWYDYFIKTCIRNYGLRASAARSGSEGTL